VRHEDAGLTVDAPVGMRVAVVAETFLPAVDGVVTSVLRLVDHLAVRGHDPVVVAPSGVGYESRCGAQVEVVTVPTPRLPRYRQLAPARPAGDLTEVLRRLAPDVVHLASPAVLGLAAARAARALGVPSVAVFQTDLATYAQRYRLPGGAAAAWRYLRTVHGTADLTLAPSSAIAAVLARQGIGPIALWPRGVDLDQFAPCHRDEALRQQLAPDGELLVGVVARLAVAKRLELLAPLSALPGVRLVVVGDGPQRRHLTRAMPQARFLGRLGGAELGEVVASLDLFVHPGADETFCQAVQEALAAGVPAVVAAAGGPLDLVRHRENGWLWAGDDPHVLAAMVAGLRDDPGTLRAAAARARPSVDGRTWGRVGDELICHLQRLLCSVPA
jgi:phosphatidylinositol alpha 1,6-mannosyltransferase